ncbi:filamentous haemagglutinin family protein [Rhodocyclus gracilis]|uniref:Filamentous hemagglutinin N-terminal domain-containing protein n=1 Tax=Rhodocyclus tenuis TaxID=1066 RepID=A0A6L5JUD6_RHOTE|nr:filamentous haemagglutinin family protein [Rhodocyclus gracilis]MQY51005.1 filamentous hemagglutinin N-terminal domain-containing protein [Rhodocyclus gracilis]
MNSDRYRVIFSDERQTWVAVAETVRGRGKKPSLRKLAAVALALTAGTGHAVPTTVTPPPNAIPVPSTAASSGRPFVFSGTVAGGQPAVTTNAAGGRDMAITTPSRTLGLNWDSFNVGTTSSVTFNQPDASARVLNRIWSNDPSVILGKLNANGQVYLINQNGILFGNGAQVNVGGLVASSLNMSDAMRAKLLNSGLPTAKGDSLEFIWDGNADGFNTGFVTVDAGAAIRTPSGGRVVLIAPKTAENLGLIAVANKSDGGTGAAEAILAAGGKVILTAPDDPALSGLLIQTTPWQGKDAQGNAVTLDGSAANRSGGRIDAGTGSVNLAALAVNQQGIVNASQAVTLNGSTMLVAGTTRTNELKLQLRGASADINLDNGTTETADSSAIQTSLISVVQNSSQAQINWSGGFRLRSDQTLRFVQPGSGSITYNFIFDETRNSNAALRSIIDGRITANGQLFLINEKGFEFRANANPLAFGGKLFHADVHAANLVVSALAMNPDVVKNGLLNQDGFSERTFYLSRAQWLAADSSSNDDATRAAERAANLAAASAKAKAAFDQATIKIGQGVTLGTADNGYAILVGSSVTQGGRISTPKGQTLIAAGADVYLKAPYSAALRGFSAEVNPLYVVRNWSNPDGTRDIWNVIAHGSIVNNGSISAALGDISLVGFNLTQAGQLATSTSVTANGSIHLVARDQVALSGLYSTLTGELTSAATARDVDSSGVIAYAGEAKSANQANFLPGQVGGTLELTPGSTTQIVLDGSSGKTITADQSFISSSIEGIGAKIKIDGTSNGIAGAQLLARGGRIQFLSNNRFDGTSAFINDPLLLAQTATPGAGIGVFVGDGARLDVSGATASKSVADLFIKVELRGDEFAGNPLQRNGALRGQTASVDIRDAVGIADLSGWIGKVGQGVAERAASGGSIALRSAGSVIVKAAAELDVSGGRVDYAAATVSESRAITTGGQSYRLNDAPTAGSYTGLITVNRQEAAYTEGKSAGTVQIVGNSVAVDGKLNAATVRGARQRNVGNPASDRYAIPLGGQLIIKDAGQHFADASASPQIVFVKGAANAAAGLDENSDGPARLELSQTLADKGFSRFDIQSDGRLDIGRDIALNLAPGGSFKASAWQMNVAGQIVAPSGSIDLSTSARDAQGKSYVYGDRSNTLLIDSGARLSVAGTWVNDYLDGFLSTTPKAINGGTLRLASLYDVDVRSGSLLDVSGGALVSTTGTLSGGNAGSITLTSGGINKPDAPGEQTTLSDGVRRTASVFLDGTLAAYALGKGGSLEIDTSHVTLGTRFDSSRTRAQSATERLATGSAGIGLSSNFFNTGGFYSFTLVGRDGVDVLANTRIVPTPANWSLLGIPGYRYQASGSAIGGFAQTRVLDPALRAAPTSLALATRSLNFGKLSVGENAYLGVSPQGSISLESWAQLTVLGTLAAPAGKITLRRPANRANDPFNLQLIDYSLGKQSESIYLGPHSRLLAGGATLLDAATRNALDAGLSADQLRSQYRYKGQVLDGGQVSIDAGLGYLVTRSGSLIDVSGAADTLNTAAASGYGGLSYAAQTIGSAGGSVSLAAREGMLLDGSYAASGQNGAVGGTFSARLEQHTLQGWDSTEIPPEMSAARQLTLFQSAGTHPEQWQLNAQDTGGYLDGTTTLPLAGNGQARLDLATLDAGKFGSWYLGSQNEIRFDGVINARVNNQLRLDAPVFSATSSASRVNFTAAAIGLGNYQSASAPPGNAKKGSANAVFSARDIGISGNFSWNGFAQSRFNSSGEIHFDSTANSAPNRPGGRNFSGQMSASGELDFAAARLSPSTWSDYRVDLGNAADGRIAIDYLAGAAAGAALSAGGRLEFSAQSIEHNGAVVAPLGEIVFNDGGTHTGSITVGSGSVTSVAADRTLLLGQTDQSGRLWQFIASSWSPFSQSLTTSSYAINSVPDKAIRIDSGNSNVKSGATLTLSGGGEAMAAEFSPGTGGKSNILDLSTLGNANVFAILPSWSGNFAPQDSQAQAYYNVTAQGGGTFSPVPSLQAGDQIRIGDGSGLAAGAYTLLPARYALLPGAYLVSVKPSQDQVVAGAKPQLDGATLIAGTRLAVNADGSSSAYSQRPLTLEIANASVLAARASYLKTTASSFFFDTAGATLPGDAGRLSVTGRNTLSFDPTVNAMYAAAVSSANGRSRPGNGLQLDLAAPKLLVTDGSSVSDPAYAGWTRIDQQKLAAINAWSLLLGGTRDSNGVVETVSSSIAVANTGASDATHSLSGSEILLSALERIDVKDGSAVSDSGNTTSSTQGLTLQNGDGAFLRVAHGAQRELARRGTVSRTAGDLVLGSGAHIAGRSLIFDGTRSTQLGGVIDVGTPTANGSRSGGAIAIGAGRINVVGDDSAPADGLNVSNTSLARFAKVDELKLASYTTIDLYGNAELGTADLTQLTLAARGIAGHGASDSVAQVKAKTVKFANPNQSSGNLAANGSGALHVNATTVVIGGNATTDMRNAESAGFGVSGFGKVNISAASELRFEGTGVTRITSGTSDASGQPVPVALSIDAGRITAAAASNQLLSASGTTQILSTGKAPDSAAGLGGTLELRSDSLDVAGRINVPAGKLTLTANAGDLHLKDGAAVSADGVKLAYGDTFAYAPAGEIVLTSATGNVNVDAGASVSVSAVSGGDAGKLTLRATQGTVAAAAGTLKGSGDSSNDSLKQGSLVIDANSVDLTALANAVLDTPTSAEPSRQHFAGSWDVRRRTGDLRLAAANTIKAAQITLAADAGNISIAGTLDASGKSGGEIGLYAKSVSASQGQSTGGRITLESTGRLLANAGEYLAKAAGTRGRGGNVTLGVDGEGSTIDLQAGGFIDVSTASTQSTDANGNSVSVASAAPSGHLTLRAPRISNALDIVATPATSTTIASTVYQVTSPGSLHAGSEFEFTTDASNTGTTSLILNNLNNYALVMPGGGTLASNALPARTLVKAVFDGSRFVIVKIGNTNYLPNTAATSGYISNTNNYTINTGTATPYYTGQIAYFTITRGNLAYAQKGQVTLNIRNQGAKPLVKNDGTSFINAGELTNGNYCAVYDGSRFVLVASTATQYSSSATTWLASSSASATHAATTASTNFVVSNGNLSRLTPGSVVSFTADVVNSGSTTLSVNGFGAIPLSKNGGEMLASGDIKSGQTITAVYDGSSFQITSLTAGNLPTPDFGTALGIGPILSTINGSSATSPVVVEAFKAYSVTGNASIDSKRLALWQADNAAFMAQAAAIASRLTQGRNDSLAVSVRPGVDLRATGDINVDNTINFAAGSSNGNLTPTLWRYGSAADPGYLSLHAGGNLNVNATISDGFTASNTTTGTGTATYQGSDRDGRPLASGGSWSYRLVAGADLAAANPLAVLANAASTGSLNINAPLVRTGTGSIALAAQGSVTLADGSAVYTAGIADTVVSDRYGNDLNFIFAPSYFRPLGGGSSPDPVLGIPYSTGDTTNNGVRAFYLTGGGDVRVSAGGSIVEATQGSTADWLVRYGSSDNDTQWYSRVASFRNGFGTLGGGNLSLVAGADIRNVMAVAPTNGRVPGINGQARADLAKINGGGNVNAEAGGSILGGTFYAESGTLRVEAGQSIASSAAANASASDMAKGYARFGLGDTQAHIVAGGDVDVYAIFNPLSSTPTYKDSSGNPLSFSLGDQNSYRTRINTYTDDTVFDLVSLNGAVTLANLAQEQGNSNGDSSGGGFAPSRVKVTTFDADTGSIIGGLSQIPGSHGQLDLLAAKNLQLTAITQYDTPATQLPGIGNPSPTGNYPFSLTIPSLAHGSTSWHANDSEASHLVALNGDISGPGSNDVIARFNEAVHVQASGDITGGLSIIAQHSTANDVTRIQAGGNVEFLSGPAATTVFQVSGPGRLEVVAGGKVDLGSGQGIVTRGNLANAFLPEGGADIFVMAGATAPNYSGFLTFLRDNKFAVGSDTSDVGLRQRFYTLLRDLGREAIAGGGEASYAKGRAAIAALFPQGAPGGGNLDLFYSMIKTEQGGNIALLAPYGGVTVGIATPNQDLLALKKPSEQGLFTIRGGDILAYVKDSFLVNQSRVFTLNGGNILVWADQGSIDAGNGAKTVSATPPPVLVVRGGQIVLDASNSVAGSGIGVLASRDDTPASDMDLFAPQGAIDAGDAGLRSTGKISLGAQTILNSNNIQAAGGVVGAPAAVAAPAPVTAPTSPTNNASAADAATAALANRDGRQGLLTVEVLANGGNGDDAVGATPTTDSPPRKKKNPAGDGDESATDATPS